MRVSAAGNMPLQGLVKPPAKPVVMIMEKTMQRIIRKRELRVRDDAIFDLGNDNRCKNNRFLRQKRKKNEKIIKNTCENDAACV